MLYFVRNTTTGKIEQAGEEIEPRAYSEARRSPAYAHEQVISRWDLKSYNDAAQLAADATVDLAIVDAEAGRPLRTFLAIDNGAGCSPRYDVVEPPRVGDDVSYGFNGDYYPCGKVTKISDSYRVITTTDDQGTVRRFYRVGQSGAWRMRGTWSLVKGVHNERNPHF